MAFEPIGGSRNATRKAQAGGDCRQAQACRSVGFTRPVSGRSRALDQLDAIHLLSMAHLVSRPKGRPSEAVEGAGEGSSRWGASGSSPLAREWLRKAASYLTLEKLILCGAASGNFRVPSASIARHSGRCCMVAPLKKP